MGDTKNGRHEKSSRNYEHGKVRNDEDADSLNRVVPLQITSIDG